MYVRNLLHYYMSTSFHITFSSVTVGSNDDTAWVVSRNVKALAVKHLSDRDSCGSPGPHDLTLLFLTQRRTWTYDHEIKGCMLHQLSQPGAPLRFLSPTVAKYWALLPTFQRNKIIPKLSSFLFFGHFSKNLWVHIEK